MEFQTNVCNKPVCQVKCMPIKRLGDPYACTHT